MNIETKILKPQLVEPKLLEKITKYQENNAPLFNKICKKLCNICYDNAIPLVFVGIVFLLLIHRYYDVKQKKKILKKSKIN